MRFLLSWRDNPTDKVFSMKEFWSFIIKETQHIMRDRRTMMILFGMPNTDVDLWFCNLY